MTSSTLPLTQEDFNLRARSFLQEIGGADTTTSDPDTNLLETGTLDSLLLIAFLAFVEQQRGSELNIGPDELKLLLTLRTAYALVRPDAPRRGV
jgi:acyl carrier protein